MKVGRLFRVEAIHRRSGTETNWYGCAARQIEPSEAQAVVSFTEAVDTLPNPLQRTRIDRRGESASTQMLEYLTACCDTMLRFEQSLKVCVHPAIVRW